MAADEKVTHTSKYGSCEIPEGVSLTSFVTKDFASRADKVALIDANTGREMTYGQLLAGINRTANGLLKAGVKDGDVLAIHLPNCLEYPIIFHAAATIGAVCTTSNPLYNAEELTHQFSATKARFVITLPMFMEPVKAAAEASGVEAVWDITAEDSVLRSTDDTPVTPATIDPKEKLLVIPFSSGTSGLPKGVMLTHQNVISDVAILFGSDELNVDMREDDVILALLPFFHIYGMTVILSTALVAGATCVVMPKFDPQVFLGAVQKHKITYLPLVPPIVLFLAKHPAVGAVDFSSVRALLSGAAPLDAELSAAAAARLGCEVRQGYGMTEMSPASHVCVPGAAVAGSCGRLLPNLEARIVNTESGECLGTGSDNRGELCIRGPIIMKGYLNNEEATRATIDEEGFLHTGDIAYVDEEGNYFIVDRLKELIKVKGFQVAPAELEGLLLEHPDIADAAVVGKPDERAGEIPKAYVVKKPDVSLTEDDVKAFIESKVAVYKKLGEVEFIDAVPKSASGKILKRVLRDRAREEAKA